MRVKELIQRFRETVDDAVDKKFWTDEEVVFHLNEAVQEACERAKLLEDRSTPGVCSITLVPGVATYDLHPSVLEIKRLVLAGRLVHETSVEHLDCTHPGWEQRRGVPRQFLLEQANSQGAPRLRLVPEPVAAGVIGLTVIRGALEPLSHLIPNAEPEIHERFHTRLLDWVYHRAYLKQDAEVFNPDKAAVSLALFERAFGERPDANVQRKQRDRRPPVVRYRW